MVPELILDRVLQILQLETDKVKHKAKVENQRLTSNNFCWKKKKFQNQQPSP
jgi:hypothetical protein